MLLQTISYHMLKGLSIGGVQVLLDISANSPSNDMRTAAQKALGPLVLRAADLVPLLQPPSLGPPTPTPAFKRAKTSKEGHAIQPHTDTGGSQSDGKFPLPFHVCLN